MITAKEFGIFAEDAIRMVMLRETVDVAGAVLHFAGIPTYAVTGQSLIVGRGWCME